MIRIAYICFVVAVFLASCTTAKLPQGENFSLQRALYVSKGMKDSEVLRVMEQSPYDLLVRGESNETWVWVYSANGETKTFSVLFESNAVIATNVRIDRK